jgi:hypothetical protein
MAPSLRTGDGGGVGCRHPPAAAGGRPLLWNVRNDLPARDMGEVVAERMRLLGPARLWREVEALEARLAAARAEQPGC